MPLVIDADAMLPLAITCKFLQSIPWWYTYYFHAQRKGHREADLSVIRCTRLFDLVFDILEVPMPDVELVARPPALHVRSSIKPGCDPLQSGGRIVRAAPKFYCHDQRVFSSASTALASVRFNGFLDEGVKEFVEPVFSISRDDQMPSPLGKLTTMLLLA